MSDIIVTSPPREGEPRGTCITGSFKSYLIAKYTIISTSSAMWLFDVIKIVTSSTVPKKIRIPKMSKAHKAKVFTTFLKNKTSRF